MVQHQRIGFESLGEKRKVATLNCLAEFYRRIGGHDKALSLYQNALKIYEKAYLDNPKTALLKKKIRILQEKMQKV
jgi:hypothetical protein